MFLMRWIKRVDFIIKIYSDRMHEIEGNLGMWKSLRVYGLDRWGPKNQDWDEKIKIPDESKDKLTRYHSKRWWQSKRSSPEYYPPSGAKNVKRIFYTLISLWVIFILREISIYFYPVVSQWLIN